MSPGSICLLKLCLQPRQHQSMRTTMHFMSGQEAAFAFSRSHVSCSHVHARQHVRSGEPICFLTLCLHPRQQQIENGALQKVAFASMLTASATRLESDSAACSHLLNVTSAYSEAAGSCTISAEIHREGVSAVT